MFSVNLGAVMADNWVMNHGGVDPAVFQTVLQGYINAFLIMGSILSAFGLLAAAYEYVRLQAEGRVRDGK